MLTRQANNWFIRSLPPPPPPAGGAPPPAGGAAGGGPNAAAAGQLNTANIEVKISPRDEWKQMFREAWRDRARLLLRSGISRTQSASAEERYAAFVEGIGSRADLNYLFAEMLGNLVVGHLGVGGGEQPDVKRVPDRPARLRLQDRERPLPVRARLQRRELESAVHARR